MNKTTEALKLAEEALVELRYQLGDTDADNAITKYFKALAAIREALAEQIPEWVDVDDYEEPVKQSQLADASLEPVATYMGHRLTPKGTKEFWGYADTVLPEKTKLYAAPVGADHFLKAIAALREGIATCRAEALEEAAKVCDKISLRFFKDRCDPQQFVSDQCAAAIRGLK